MNLTLNNNLEHTRCRLVILWMLFVLVWAAGSLPVEAFTSQINCGGAAASPFVADTEFSGGTVATTAATITLAGVPNAAPTAVYQAERYGASTYTLTGLAASTAYVIRLHFSESGWGSAGQRQFNVAINGSTVLTNFDILAIARAQNTAVVRNFNATSNGSGVITVAFSAGAADTPEIRGIEIVAGTVPTAPTGVYAITTSTSAVLHWTAVTGATSYNIYRSTTIGGEGSVPYATGVSGTSYTNSSLTTNTEYYYKVVAVSANGESAQSTEIAALPSTLLLPTSETTGYAWRYTTSTPSASWNSSSFDDSSWTLAPAGFGTSGFAHERTIWSGAPLDIWVRKHFTINGSVPAGRGLRVFYDEGGDVYINGTAAATLPSFTGMYVAIPFTTAGQSALVVGDNVIAIHITNTAGNQYLDAGLEVTPPTNIYATTTTTAATLHWTANAGATSYNIYKGTSSGGESGTAFATGVTGTSWTDSGLTTGTKYYYTIASVDASGTGTASSEVVAAPNTSGTVAYQVNAGGSAASPFQADAFSDNNGWPSSTSNTITVTGVPNVAPAAVYQSCRNNNFTYTFGGLTPSTSYVLRMHFADMYDSVAGNRQFNVAINGTSVLSNFDVIASAGAANKAVVRNFNATADANGNIAAVFTTGAADIPIVNGFEVINGTIPTTPTGVTAALSTTTATISWTAVTGATSYSLYRSNVGGGEGSVPYRTGISGTSSADTGLTYGTKYFYTVVAVNANGESVPSSEVAAIPNTTTTTLYQVNTGGPIVSPFEADNYFSGGYTASNSSAITVAGVPNAAPAAVYQTEHAGTPTYTFAGLTASTNYVVRLHFAEIFGSGTGARQFNVLINGATVLTNFDVYAAAGNFNQAMARNFNATSSSGGVITVALGTGAAGVPKISAIEILGGSVTAAPTGVYATSASTTATVNWTVVSGATSYNIYRSTATGGEGSIPLATGVTGTSYTNTGLTNGTRYYYIVTAVNADGESAPSSEMSAVPNTAGTAAYQLNAGGPAVSPFTSDDLVSGGSTFSTASTIATTGVFNAAPMAVYQTERAFPYTYTIPGLTPSTNYVVRLHFAETYWTTSGQRVFNVAINGATVLSNFDVIAASGAQNSAVVRNFNATANATGQITIAGTVGTIDQPEIRALEIINGSVPTVPTGIYVTTTTTAATINWTAVSGATSYNLYRSTTSGAEFAVPYKTALTGTSYTDLGLTTGTKYYYMLVAVNANGESAATSEITAVPNTAGTVAYQIAIGGPAVAPFAADSYGSGGFVYTTGSTIAVAGVPNAAPAAVYQAERSGAMTYTMLGLTPGTNYVVRLHFSEQGFTTTGSRQFNVLINGTQVLTNFDTVLAAGAWHAAVVRNFNVVADSSGDITVVYATGALSSPQGSGIEVINGSITAAPTGVTATAGLSSNALAWGAVTGATSYSIYRSTTAGTEGNVPYATGQTGTTYSDSSVTNGTTYYYKIVAVNANGESAASSEVSATSTAGTTSLQINAGGTASAPFVADAGYAGGSTTTTANTITVTGIANVAPAAVYQSERNGTFSYIFTGLTASSAYVVRLHEAETTKTAAGQRQFNVAINGSSAATNFDIFAAAAAQNKAVTRNYNATSNGSGQITVSFTAGAFDVPKVNGLEVAAGSVPAAPTGVTAYSGNTTASIAWPGVGGATSYNIYRSTTSGSEGSVAIANVGASDGSTWDFNDNGLTNGTTYYYRVTAVNSNGEGPASAEVSAVPALSTATKINAGGGASSPFVADVNFTGGTLWTVTNTITVTGVPNVAPAAVYQTMRYGNMSYTLTGLTASSPYVVRLHFAETGFSAAGGRLFSASINGATVLSNFDIWVAANAGNVPVVRNFNTTSNGSGNVVVSFADGSANHAMINAIEVIAGTVTAAPTGVTATGGVSSVALAWGTVTGATSYNIYRSTAAGAEGSVPYVTGQAGTSYSDSSVTNGTTYYYTVVAVNANGESAASSEVSATPTAGTTSLQINAGGSAASPFVADAGYGGGSTTSTANTITVTGVANVAPAAVYQSERNGTFSYIFTGLTASSAYVVRLHEAETTKTAAGQRQFNIAINGSSVATNFDIFAAAGAQNRAVTRSYNATSNGSGQITVSFTAGAFDVPKVNGLEVAAGSVLTAPTGLSTYGGNTSATVNWGAVSGATSYNIYRSTTAGGEGSIAIATGLNANARYRGYNDTGLTNGTTYYYIVTAVNANGESTPSSEISVVPAATTTSTKINAAGPATAPFSVDAGFSGGTIFNTSASITVAGIPNAAPAAVYQTQRFSPSTYTISGLTASSAYVVRLHFAEVGWGGANQRQFNVAINGSSVLTNFDICAAANAANTAVVRNFNATSNGSGQISIALTNGALDLAAINGIEVIAGTVTAAPAGVTATGGLSSNALAWGAVTGATSYNIYRSTTAGAEGSVPYVTGQSGTSYSDSSVTNGTTYYYTVVAVNANGESAASSEVSGTPTAGTTSLQINAGGSAASPFVADAGYAGGSTLTTANTITVTGVANAAPAAVYQSERNGTFSYIFTGLTASSAYVVRLHEAETTKTAAGQRQFNVAINGSSAATNFDIFAAAGAQNRAVTRSYNATSNGSGQITVSFTAGAFDVPKVNGLEVVAGSVLTAPTGVVTYAGNAAASVYWTTVAGATSYNVYRSTTSGGEGSVAVATGIAGDNYMGYNDSGLTNGTTYYYTVTAVNANGESVASTEASVVPVATTASTKINAGGSASAPFSADSGFSSSNIYNTPTAIAVTGVPNAAPAAVYQSRRYNPTTYVVSGLTASTAYVVRLHFAETYWTAAGQRQFNVAINGSSVLSNFDIVAAANAANAAVVRNFNATSNGSGQITIAFTNGAVDTATINAIEVVAGTVTAAPTSVTATGGLSSVALAWGTVTGATSYNIYRSTTAGAEGSVPYVTGQSGTSYSDTSGTNGTTYYYKIVAVNANGESAASSEVSGTPTAGTTSLQINAGGSAAPPFVADAGYGGGSTLTTANTITVAGVANAAPAAVYQSERNGTFNYIFTGLTASSAYVVRLHEAETTKTAAGQRQFNVAINGSTVATNFDIFAAAGGQNRAVTRSYNATSNGSGQITVSFTGGAFDVPKVNGLELVAGTVPAVPSGVFTMNGNGAVTVSWSPVTGATGYNVYRATTSGGETSLVYYANAGVAGYLSYTETGLTNGSSYYYIVTATNANGESAQSSEVVGTPAAGTTSTKVNSGGNASSPFAADGGFSGGNLYLSTNTITVAGVPNAAPAAVYQSERYGVPLTYTFSGLTASTAYVVRLHFAELSWSAAGQRQFNAAINGSTVLTNFDIWAAANAANTAVVRNFSATSDSSGNIVVTFTNGAADRVKVSGIEVIAGTVTASPTGVTATPGIASNALAWSAVSGATSYNIYRSTTAGTEGSVPFVTGQSGTSYSDSSLTNGTTYYYKIVAVNANGESAASSEVSGTPTAGTTSLQINAGGSAAAPFVADAGYAGGSTTNTANTITVAGVQNSAPAAVYQSERNGTFSYVFTGLTASSAYVVRLHEAETTKTAAGQRQFNVAINGSSVATNFDIFAAAGAQNRAVTRSYNATSNGSGQITVSFTAGAFDVPKVNGLEVVAGTVPSAPTGVYATSGNTQSSISWGAVSGATSYNIYRSTTAGGEGSVALVTGQTGTSYNDGSLTNGTTYYYTVTAVNANGESPASSEVSAAPAAGTASTKTNAGGPASAPFTADGGYNGGSTGSTASSVTITGVPNAAPAAVYQTERNGVFTYTFTGLAASSAYVVRLHEAETSKTAAGQRQFNVSINGSSVLTNFDIFAAAGAQNQAVVRSFNATSDGSGNVVVSFTAGAVDVAKVNALEVVAGTVPAAPTGVYAITTTTSATVNWTAVSGATSYNIYRSTTIGAEGSVPYATGVSGTSYTNSGLTTNTEYYYTVVAVNANGESAASTEIAALPSTLLLPTSENAGYAWRYTTTTPSASWNTSSFDDSSWTLSPAAFGTSNYPHVRTNWSTAPGDIWIRKHFTINGSVPAGRGLRAMYDDNADFYINGVLAGSRTGFTSTYLSVPLLSAAQSALVVGDNVIAVHVFNGGSHGYADAGLEVAAPAGLYITSTATTATLNWTANAGATSYNIYRSTTSGGEGSTPYASGVTGTSWTDSGLTTGTKYYYTMASVDATGTGTPCSEVVGIPNTAGTVAYQINANGSVVAPFQADAFYSGGGTYSTASTVTTSGVPNAAPAAVYQTLRKTGSTYTLTGLTPSTNYVVRLHFAEIGWTAAGKRQFNVAINSTNVLTNFDIFAAANAANTAVVRNFNTTADGNGQITLAFTNGALDVAAINGIEIIAGTVTAAPTGVTATGGLSSVALAWGTVTGATSYNIYRSTTAGAEGSVPYVTGQSGTTYSDTSGTNGTTYYYKIVAVNANGESATSSEVSGTPTAGTTSLQINAGGSAASPFVADAGYGGGSTLTTANTITVTNVANAAPAAVYQSERNGTFSYTFTGLTASSAYVVRLHEAETTKTAAGQRQFNVAINGSSVATNFDIFAAAGAQNTAVTRSYNATSNGSGQITVSFSAGAFDVPKVNGLEVVAGSVPSAPTGAYALSGNAAATLVWSAVSGATSYNIYRSTTPGGEGSVVYNLNYTATSYTNSALTNGTTYYYTVTAVNANGEGPACAEFSVTPSAYTTSTAVNAGGLASAPFVADTGFSSGSIYSSTNTITVAGVPNAAPAAVYQSQRYGAYTYTFGGLTANTSYVVRLHMSEFSNNYAGQRYFNVAINGNSALANFDIYVAAGGANKAVVRNFNVTSDGTGKIVISVSGGAGSPDSPQIAGLEVVSGTVTAAPTGVTATGGVSSVALAWGAVTGATSYNIYRSTTAGAEGSVPYATGQTGTSYTDSSVTNGTTYYYKVVAVNANGESAASSEVSATPTAGTTSLQINAGGGASAPFVADAGYAGGSTLTTANTITIAGVQNAAPAAVYQSERNGTFSYIFTGLTASSAYVVRLHEAETTKTAAGQRQFNVSINGSSVATNFDIFAAAGAQNRAVTRSYNATSNGSGQITVSFTAGAFDVPKVNGLEVAAGSVLSAPTGLSTYVGNGSVAVNWGTVAGATSYNVYRSTSSGGEGSVAFATGQTGTTYPDNTVTNGTTYYYTVTAVNANGESPASSETSVTPTATTTSTKINAGGPASAPFAADSGFGGGGAYSSGSTITTTGVPNAAPAAVYQSGRGGGPFTYSISGLTASTAYVVRLHFTDQYSSGTGQRVFNVAINGSSVLTNFDIFGVTGAQSRAAVRNFNATSDGTGKIVVTFTDVVGPSLVNALEVIAGTVTTAPAGVTATPGLASNALAWGAVSGATSYNIYRGTTAGGEGSVPLATGQSGTSYTDSSVTNGTTYYYTVVAVNANGESAASSEVSATPTAGTTSLQINAGGGASSPFVADTGYAGGSTTSTASTITVAGVQNAAPAAVYQTERNGTFSYIFTGLTASSAYVVRLHEAETTKTAAGQRQFNVAINGSSVATNFDIFAAAGAQNTAVTRSYNATSNGSGQITVSFTAGAFDIPKVNGLEVVAGTVPAAPTGVTMTAGGVQNVNVSWTAVTGATGYNIYRSTTAGGEGSVRYGTTTGTNFLDTPIAPSTTYYYTVVAVNANGESAASSEVSGAARPSTTSLQINAGGPASAPFVADAGYLNGSTTTTGNTIVVAGVPNAAPAAVYQSERNGAFSYAITGLTANSAYVLRIHEAETTKTAAGQRQFNIDVNGGRVATNVDIFAAAGAQNRAVVRNYNVTSNATGQLLVAFGAGAFDVPKVNGIEILAGSVTAAPTGLSVSAGSAQSTLTWSAATGATSYNIYRSTTAGTEGSVAYATGQTGTTYTDSSLTNGTTYYYTITAVNANGESAASNEASGAPNAAPTAPTGLTATPGNASATLTWTAATGGGTITYTVLRSTTNGSGYTAVTGGSGLSATSFTDPTGGTALTNGTTYYYVVTASNNGGTSANSSQVVVVPSAPTLLLAKRITAINGVNVTGFVTDGTGHDTSSFWPSPSSTYLRGATTSAAKPGDTVEYTIYFLVTGSGSITNVTISDVLPANTTYVSGAYTGQTPTDGVVGAMGIAVASSATAYPTSPTVYMTNASDADRGTFYAASTAVSGICTAVQNVSGALVVSLVSSPATLPAATASGSPFNSYGFVRFKVTVN